MLEFLRKNLRKRAIFLFTMLLCVAMLSAACSNDSDDDDDGVTLLAPNNLALTAKSGSLAVQFTRVMGVGAKGQEKYPTYEVSIGTKEDGSDRHVFDEEVPASTSFWQGFAIGKAMGGDYTDYAYNLEDGKQYYIFVRSNFASAGYGYSEYSTPLSAVPIPMPQPISGLKVEKGDGRLVVTWDAKPYEEYALNTDSGKGVVGASDCPFNYTQLTRRDDPSRNWWGAVFSTIEDNYVFTFDDNDETYNICIFSTNINGDSKWAVLGEINDVAKTVSYSPQQGVAATLPPVAPTVTVDKNTNKRVEISFTPVLTGGASVAKYGYMVKESTSADWPVDWTPMLISSLADDGKAHVIVPGLENDKTYDIKVGARNTIGPVETGVFQGKPIYIPLNPNDPDEYLSKANSEYIYAEDVPHSDFIRISTTDKRGGHNWDRLVRGKETALGNLYADAVQWYLTDNNDYDADFTWLMGEIINTGIQANQTITKRFLQGITHMDYLDDTIVIVSLKGSDIINAQDYALDLNNYPAVAQNNLFTKTLLGQAAALYHTAHYGGGGTYNGAYWGLPSSELRYTIEYLHYSIDDFNANFNSKPECVAARSANNGEYDSVADPYGCYLYDYDLFDSDSSSYKPGYNRGKINSDAKPTINGASIDPDRTYRIATTKRIADGEYAAFLSGTVENTNVTMIDAIAEYIYNNGSAGMTPALDGRVKIMGGVPGDPENDF